MRFGIETEIWDAISKKMKGVTAMCKSIEEMRKEERIETRIEVAIRMLNSGKLTYEEIASFVDMTVEEVKELDERRTA